MSDPRRGQGLRGHAVLAQIRARLASGAVAPGATLAVNELAAELGVSPTPVREALAHLAGEGLVAERRGLGYFAPDLDAADLAGLFDLEALIAGEALRRWRPGAGFPRDECGPDQDAGLSVLFAGLIALTEDPILQAAYRQVAQRLAPARLHEVTPDLEAAIAQFAQALRRGDRDHARRVFRRCVDLRRKSAARIALALKRRRNR